MYFGGVGEVEVYPRNFSWTGCGRGGGEVSYRSKKG